METKPSIRYMGGSVEGRPEGEIFDQKTGQQINWHQSVIVSFGKQRVSLSRDGVAAVIQFAQKYPDFVDGCL